MKSVIRCPSLYQLNTRVLVHDLGTSATIADVPQSTFELIKGFDFIWLLGVWQTGCEGPLISRTHPELQKEYRETLPDLSEKDICGSPFAVSRYETHRDFGGDSALRAFRSQLKEQGQKLILDFVPNHMAVDHEWIALHPDYLVRATLQAIEGDPHNWFRPSNLSGTPYPALAHGRDPNYSGWTDTVQLNYQNKALQAAMLSELLRVAERCDGVRCDMAMLLLPDIFRRTWRNYLTDDEIPCFWTHAIRVVKERYPDFIFMAEVYWNLEHELIQRGFDYAYDKRLYDRLLHAESCAQRPDYPAATRAQATRSHLCADISFQRRLARFLENHDEPRIASRLPTDEHKAAAVITFLAPGLRFFHQGQFEGKHTRIPVHLRRGPYEPVDEGLKDWYQILVTLINSRFKELLSWKLLEACPAWSDNLSFLSMIATQLETSEGQFVIAVNFSSNHAECFIRVDLTHQQSGSVEFTDLLAGEFYERKREDILARGLYLAVSPWKAHLFQIRPSYMQV